EQHGILGDEPLRGLDADARTRLDIACIILAPQLAPAGIDDDGVARLQRDVLLLQRALEILDRDLVSVAEHFDALVAGDVDQHTPSYQRAQNAMRFWGFLLVFLYFPESPGRIRMR